MRAMRRALWIALLCGGCSYPTFGFSPGADAEATPEADTTSPTDTTVADTVSDEAPPDAATDTRSADAARCDGVTCAPCPTDMIEMNGSGTVKTYCIDRTEVTRAQYKAWLETSPSLAGQPAECAWNKSVTPSMWPAPAGTEAWPVTYVDWCDAWLYCKAAGRRLCGKVGGGPSDNVALPDRDEYTRACSNGGTYDYPYGDGFDPSKCNGSGSDAGHPLDVGSFPGCKSAFGTFDQSGNVSEWENSCVKSMLDAGPDAEAGTDPALDMCQARGGDYLSTITFMRCDHGFGAERNDQRGTIGFRCCAD